MCGTETGLREIWGPWMPHQREMGQEKRMDIY